MNKKRKEHSAEVDTAYPRSPEFLDENLGVRHGIFSYELLVRSVPEPSLPPTRTMQAVAIALVNYQNWVVRPYCCGYNTPWFQDVEKSSWNWPETSLLAFIMLSRSLEEKSHQCYSLPSTKACMLQSQNASKTSHRSNSGTKDTRTTNHF